MKRISAFLLVSLVCGRVCSGQYNDRIAHLKNSPFSATVRGWYENQNSLSSWKEDIARASDGNVYEATFVQVGEYKGSIERIRIEDAASNCNIVISPYQSHLTRDSLGHVVGGTRGLSIHLETGKSPVPPAPTVEDIQERLLREQKSLSDALQAFHRDTGMQRISLGQRNTDGMTIFGFQTEHLSDSQADGVSETWESTLGFTYSRKSANSTEGNFSGQSVTDLKLVEPPSELFTVQDKYFPPTSTLPNAKKIFISGMLDNAELMSKIESILTASGRFTIEQDLKDADLVVRSIPEREEAGNQAHPSNHQILLGFQKPNGVDLIWVEMRFNGAADQWAQSPLVDTYFSNLWKRVENLQPPASPSLEEGLY